MSLSVSDLRYSRLDLRTCAEIPVRRFAGLASEFSWGAAPDDLWIFAPHSLREVEPIAGGPRIDVSADLRAQPDWPEPNPEVPREADVGMGWRPTGLHVWDLQRRVAVDVPTSPGIKVESIVMPQSGDRTLLAVARSQSDAAPRQLEVIAVPAPRPEEPSPTASTVHVALSGDSGPLRTRSLAGGARLALVAETGLGGSERELIVVDATGGTEGYRMELGGDPWAWTRTGRPWFVRATNFTRPSPTTMDCRSSATIVDLETGHSRVVPTPGCTQEIQMVDAAPFAILQGRYRVEVTPGGGGSPAATDEDVMAIVNRAYPTVSRLLLDLVRGTLTSLPEAPGKTYVMGDTVYFADTTRILAIDLGAPGRMRVAVTGLQNARSFAVEPSSRRLVMVDDSGGILVFDANKGLVTRCH